ncbi:MAG: basic amino acid ABC transporter substrate-binding protein [Firmicutes bacterium]|nr:basic amino acid ABC transporter substrate-binding protein [Bacillota bacterium]
MKKLALLIVSVLLVSLLAHGVLAKDDDNVLKVAASCDFPPFEFVDEETGEYVGFDLDLVKAIAKEMGMEVEIINTAWDGLIPGLLNNNYDMIASAMTITEERKMAVDFSDPYFQAKQVILVPIDDNSIKSVEDLKGKIVTVQIGTTGDFTASEIKGLKKVARFNLAPEAIQEVLNGNAAACIIDNIVAVQYIKENPGKVKIVEGDFFGSESYGLAIKKGNKELLEQVNKALKTIKANGIYDKIASTWF